MENFSTRLKGILNTKNISQKELAEMAGTTGATISRYANENRTPNAELLNKIATALECTTDFLLGKSDTPNPEPPTLDLEGFNLYDEIQKGGFIIHSGEKYDFNDLNDENQKTMIQIFKALAAEQNRKGEGSGS